ncbi:MAG: 30S ribosomal protein S17 [Chloroflexi bacterium]|nr:30S ribosomal protein S17 [Chloroflexota bacterium]MBU1750910.1 30S ribosomal protein S17 [Chloroflexota bacterium]MBU1879653.1 30S ribosomal protein S17 [Chloroflexota bacterium]
MDKTVVVAVERLTRHPLYHKIIKQTKRFMAHDENEICQEGDMVRIVETRPLSRHKRWRVVEIIGHGLQVTEQDLEADAHVPAIEPEDLEADVHVSAIESEDLEADVQVPDVEPEDLDMDQAPLPDAEVEVVA